MKDSNSSHKDLIAIIMPDGDYGLDWEYVKDDLEENDIVSLAKLFKGKSFDITTLINVTRCLTLM